MNNIELLFSPFDFSAGEEETIDDIRVKFGKFIITVKFWSVLWYILVNLVKFWGVLW